MLIRKINWIKMRSDDLISCLIQSMYNVHVIWIPNIQKYNERAVPILREKIITTSITAILYSIKFSASSLHHLLLILNIRSAKSVYANQKCKY